MDRKKIVVIGAGPGGYVAALRAAALGGDVTVIEKEHPGGTCLNWGCIPSKIMKTSADIYMKLKEADEFGIKIDGSVIPDMSKIMARKQKIVETQRKGILSLLQHAKINFEQGRGYIKGKGIVAVINENEQGDNAPKEKEINYDKLIIATGTAPLNIPAFPFDGEYILSSNHLLSLNEIPKSIVIVGGGVIGCEFACILSALGSDVTIIEAMSRLLPLPSVDESCSATLQREMKKRKIKIITDKVVEKAEKVQVSKGFEKAEKDKNLGDSNKDCENSNKDYENSDKNKVKLILTLGHSPFTDKGKKAKEIEESKGTAQKPQIIEADKMAVCIGRSPLAADLGLENIGLKTNEKGWIDVNDKMETAVDGVYAIGDILGPNRIMLAHVASHEGMVAAFNAVNSTLDDGQINCIKSAEEDGGYSNSDCTSKNNFIEMNYNAVPSAIFTMPEIGNAGLTEAQAKAQGFYITCSIVNFRTLGKAHAVGEIAGEAKIIAQADTGKVLGVHITGPHATDLIAEGTLAVNKGLTLSDIAHTIHAHPTLAEIMSEAALKGCGMALHG